MRTNKCSTSTRNYCFNVVFCNMTLTVRYIAISLSLSLIFGMVHCAVRLRLVVGQKAISLNFNNNFHSSLLFCIHISNAFQTVITFIIPVV